MNGSAENRFYQFGNHIMSRIGKKPIEIPQGVTVEMVANKITVSGSKGKLELVLVHDVKVEIKDNKIILV